MVGVNAGDPATEFAVDNPALPLPRDVAYTWVVGSVRGLGADGVVDADRQVLRRRADDGAEVLVPEGITRRVTTSRVHTAQTSDVATIRAVLGSLATPTAAPPVAGLELASFPNPARSAVTVTAQLAQPGPVRLSVVDALGRDVAVLAEGVRPAGPLRVEWSAAGLAPGAYVVVLDAGGARRSVRVTVVR